MLSITRPQGEQTLPTPLKRRVIVIDQRLMDAQTLPPKKRQRPNAPLAKPSDFVLSAFKENGVDIENEAARVNGNFIKPTQEMIDAYTVDTLVAARQNNLSKLKELHANGTMLNCCNKFGESLMHLACRRGNIEMVKFLIHEAKVSLNVCDDYRRTPLHDACWTPEPCFGMMEILINEAPELLIIKDVRGFTPFDYVRKDHWGAWMEFLTQHKALLRPKKDSEQL
jgi:hypothetical protein